jgi:hypothetical protein
MRRIEVIYTLLSTVIIFWAQAGHAFSCYKFSEEEMFKRYDAVIVAKVLSAKDFPDRKKTVSWYVSSELEAEALSVTKGLVKSGDTLKIKAFHSVVTLNKPHTFEIGKTYRFYLLTDYAGLHAGKGEFFLRFCAQTKALEKGDSK